MVRLFSQNAWQKESYALAMHLTENVGVVHNFEYQIETLPKDYPNNRETVIKLLEKILAMLRAFSEECSERIMLQQDFRKKAIQREVTAQVIRDFDITIKRLEVLIADTETAVDRITFLKNMAAVNESKEWAKPTVTASEINRLLIDLENDDIRLLSHFQTYLRKQNQKHPVA